jgi:pyridoxine 4-dehydrogenase
MRLPQNERAFEPGALPPGPWRGHRGADVVNFRRQRGMETLTKHFAALAALREAGPIQHLGVSGLTPEQLGQAQAITPVGAIRDTV